MCKKKVLIVEDEAIISARIYKNLQKLDYQILEPVGSYSEAILVMNETTPDIAIIDIRLNGSKSGVDLAEYIRENYDFPFVFLTANSDAMTVSAAKKTNPNGYLVKPFTKEDLYTTLEVALYNYLSTPETSKEPLIEDTILVKHYGKYIKILCNDITYIKSEHVYLVLFLKDGSRYYIREQMNLIVKKLSIYFIRVHKSYIINIKFLDYIEKNKAYLADEIIPIGDRYKASINKSLLKY